MPDFDLDAALTGPPPGRVRRQALTEAETLAMFQELGHVEGVVIVELNDIFEGFEAFLDNIASKLSDTMLGSLDYEIVGVQPPTALFVRVTAGEVMGGVAWDAEADNPAE